MLFADNVTVEQDVIVAAITIALIILYLYASDVHQHSTFNRGRAATFLSEELFFSTLRQLTILHGISVCT